MKLAKKKRKKKEVNPEITWNASGLLFYGFTYRSMELEFKRIIHMQISQIKCLMHLAIVQK